MSKKERFITLGSNNNPNAKYATAAHQLRNKYYQLWKSNYHFEGIDWKQEEYILKEFYDKGTVACSKINKELDALIFYPWVRTSLDQYGDTATLNAINQFNSPLVPSGNLVVDYDTVIGYCMNSRKPVKFVVDWYVDRIVSVMAAIDINLQLNKLPYVIGVEKDERDKAQQIIDKILNNDIAVFTDGFDTSFLKALVTGVPMLIPQLYAYQQSLENELLTILGVSNSGHGKCEQVQTIETQMSNVSTQSYDEDMKYCINKFWERVKDTFGVTVRCNYTRDSIQDEFDVQERKEYETDTKEDETNDN